MLDPEFLDLSDVLEIHERQIEAFGGLRGLRDQCLLESAVAMPLEQLARPAGDEGATV